MKLKQEMNISLEDYLDQLCGSNHTSSAQDAEKISLVKSLIIDLLNTKVSPEIAKAFDKINTSNKNRNFRFKELFSLAKEWKIQKDLAHLNDPYYGTHLRPYG